MGLRITIAKMKILFIIASTAAILLQQEAAANSNQHVVTMKTEAKQNNSKPYRRCKYLDLTGEKYNHLIIQEVFYDGKIGFAKCKCDCGKIHITRVNDLRTGNTKSCGCHKLQLAKERFTTHGMTKSPVFNVWQKMKNRCFISTDKSYFNYGGRGITVCDRWVNGDGVLGGFECFHQDMGNPPDGTQLDRYPNNDGNYEPGNCRWATREQNGSNKRNNVNLTFNGRTMTQSQWARELGISQSTIVLRIKKGLSMKDILSPRTHVRTHSVNGENT